MTAYPHLLAPITLSGVPLRNRVVMGSMHVGLEEEGGAFEKWSAYFAARARGGVGLIVTGGVAPNLAGSVKPFAATLTSQRQARRHRHVTDAVHAEGGRIAMQILHAGRYAYHPFAVAPSRRKSPISWFTPWGLTGRGVNRTIDHFARCAGLAREAGYDGVEVMGSEGYLINQFIAPRTNHRRDGWGGSYANRIRFPTEILRRVRQEVGQDFIIVYRLSLLDLVPDGSTWPEVLELATAVEAAGASVINTGIGWHEARVPTIATSVPRAAFTWVTRRLRESGATKLPIIASNRLNTPEVAEAVLARGDADLVSLARPLLADPEFVNKAAAGKADRINTCIACNQACLDHAFENKRASCLVNPFACYETELVVRPAAVKRKVAVVGGGMAGMSAACVAAERGHAVTLFEARDSLGGQFELAREVPGKEEFAETLRYFRNRLADLGVTVSLGVRVHAELVRGFDAVIVATGVRPRGFDVPGAARPNVVSYAQVLRREVEVGPRAAIVGAGGIGYDVAEFLGSPAHESPEAFLRAWGVNVDQWAVDPAAERGGLAAVPPAKPVRQLYLLQRKATRHGLTLGKTTGWIHRAQLKHLGVELLAGVEYRRVDDQGLHIAVNGKERLLAVDHVVVCAGQVPERSLADALQAAGVPVQVIGGADQAAELDAKRAIRQGVEAALTV